MANPFGPGGLLDFLNNVPGAGYAGFLRSQGVSPTMSSPFASYVRGRYGDLYEDYQSELPYNPSLLWTDYLKRFNMGREFSSLSPKAREVRLGGGAGTVKYNTPF